MSKQFSWNSADSWIPLLRRLKEPRPSRTVVEDAILAVYDCALVYHGCRPLRVQPYYRHGLLVADNKAIDKRARRLFSGSTFPEITDEIFQRAIQRIPESANGRAHVVLDDSGFLETSGHYLIYGTERVIAIAANLSGELGRDYRTVLRSRGKPTIFRLSLPLDHVSESDVSEFAEAVRRQLSSMRRGKNAPPIDFTFTLRRSLGPETILDHYHPVEITDPLMGFVKYHYPNDRK